MGGTLSDLTEELAAALDAVTAADCQVMRGARVPPAMFVRGFLGVARVLVEGEHYQPHESGGRAFITPVRVLEQDSPEDPDFDVAPSLGALIDLVAWHPRFPDRWALRRGAATWLGAIPPQVMAPPPVPIRRSPLAWLRAGGTGLCILTGDPGEAQRLLLGCSRLLAENDEHAKELRRIVTRPYPAPRVYVARSKAEAAA